MKYKKIMIKMNNTEINNDDFVKQTKTKLVEMGWESICADKFAQFLEKTNQNNTNCYPDKYPYWCEFVISAYRLPKEQRPNTDMITYVLQEMMEWEPNGEPVNHLIKEYLKGITLLNFFNGIK